MKLILIIFYVILWGVGSSAESKVKCRSVFVSNVIQFQKWNKSTMPEEVGKTSENDFGIISEVSSENVLSLSKHRLSQERKRAAYLRPALDDGYVTFLEPYSRKVLAELVQMIHAETPPTYEEYLFMHKLVWVGAYVLQAVRNAYLPEAYEHIRDEYFLLYSVYYYPEMSKTIERWGFERLDFEERAQSFIVQNMPELGVESLIPGHKVDSFFGIGDLKPYIGRFEGHLFSIEYGLDHFDSEFLKGYNEYKTTRMSDIVITIEVGLISLKFLRKVAGDRLENLSSMQYEKVQDLYRSLLGLQNHPVFRELVDQPMMPTLMFYARKNGLVPNKYISAEHAIKDVGHGYYLKSREELLKNFKFLKKEMKAVFGEL